MKNIDDYIPVDIFHEASDFIKRMDEDVEIYKTCRRLKTVSSCIEADKFVAFWSLGRYSDFPHALITLYEHKEEIENGFGGVDTQNVLDFMQFRMKCYYLLLKENGMIGE